MKGNQRFTPFKMKTVPSTPKKRKACDPNGKVHSEHQSKYASIISEEALVKIKQLK